MLSVSATAKIVGVARSTLLYYERKGVITPGRNSNNGYREYSRSDINKLLQLRQLQQAGFTLIESVEVVQGDLDPSVIRERYLDLNNKIESMILAREIVKSLLSRTTGEKFPDGMNGDLEGIWHAAFEDKGADAHSEWLKQIGLSEKEALYTRWVTRSISNNDEYMSDFFKVYEKMVRQGPGSKATTLRVIDKINSLTKATRILEIGCGKGESCLVLAKNTDAHIIAVDNHQPFLDHISEQAALSACEKRIQAVNMSMFNLDFEPASFDLIWAEGSAYFMGFERAIEEWRKLIRERGFLFISDAVWLVEKQSPDCRDYWKIEYPNMKNIEQRKKQVLNMGYSIEDWFILPREDWKRFFDDMEFCVSKAIRESGMTRTFKNILKGIEIDKRYGCEYGYLCMVLQRSD